MLPFIVLIAILTYVLSNSNCFSVTYINYGNGRMVHLLPRRLYVALAFLV